MLREKIAYDIRECLLAVKGVNLNLGGRPILRDVNFEVHNLYRPGMLQGQVVGLLGPSGMGKTQLFRILAGLNPPDSGEVLIGDPPVPVAAGMVGVVAQHYPLLHHRTILGNLVVAGRQAGQPAKAAETEAKRLLEVFGLKEQGEKYPVQLSGGQRQRAAIAQQFMCSNQLMLMDEPFSGLDPLALARMCQFIKDIAQTDELKTFVIVTHDIASAIEVCDTLMVLGRDKGPDGHFIPGAKIQQTVDLIARGLAWHTGISRTPEFHAAVNEVKDLFAHL
jgi:polar amino acid transport system ATP-binding protein/sulfate transport system ATP-binding protein